MELELKGLEPSIVRAACQAFAGKCLVERDMVSYSLCDTVSAHPDRVKELIDRSPQFLAELLRQRKKYDYSRLK